MDLIDILLARKLYGLGGADGITPHPLTFTGAVEATYDGSTPVEVEIPMGGSGEWEYHEVTLTEEVNYFSILFDWASCSELWCHLLAVAPTETALDSDKKVYFGEGRRFTSAVVPGTLEAALPASGQRQSYIHMNIQCCDKNSTELGVNGFTTVVANGSRKAGDFSSIMNRSDAQWRGITMQTDSGANFGVGTTLKIWGR